MRNAERSLGTLLCGLVAAALLAGSFAVPWFEYDYSSGRKTAPGGYNDPADTRVERHTLTYGPFTQEGDVTPTDPEGAARATDWMGWAVTAAAVLLALVALADIPGLPRLVPRPLGLVLLVAAIGAAGTALWLGWYRLPETLSGLGVTGPFTYFLTESGTQTGYTRTNIGWGWILAAASVPFWLGAALFKFQTGMDSELYLHGARTGRKDGKEGRPQ